MNKLLCFSIVFGIFSGNMFSQKTQFPVWGSFSEFENNLTKYEKDSTAHAVILHEVGYSYTQTGGDFNIITEYHIRIKILDPEGFDAGTIKIRHYKDEIVSRLKAATTNGTGNRRTVDELNSKNVYNVKLSENWKSVNFTFPNLQAGSILEYSYRKESPHYSSFGDGWTFQNTIPTLKSTYYVRIPGFWTYNISTINMPKQNIIQHVLIKNCLEVGPATADCLFLELEETDVPAFIEEDFLTSKYNFLRKINFELKTFTDTYGVTKQYTKTWPDTDKKINETFDFAKEIGDTKFIKKYIPIEFLNEPDELIRAQKIFNYIKHYFNWNGKNELFHEFNSKKAFESKTGNMVEINTTLINALLAAGISTNMALLSTRENGKVTKLFPVIMDFNYLVANVKINGKDYFLDATNNFNAFGMLPFECLNNDIRVFPKKENSYWVDFFPEKNNRTNILSTLEINEEGELSSQIKIVYEGYKALEKRLEISEMGQEKYIENEIKSDVQNELSNYTIEGFKEFHQPLIESFQKTSVDANLVENRLFIKPFPVSEIGKNPFKQNDRQYPVDFGYLRQFNQSVIFTIPADYKVEAVPQNRKFLLPAYEGEMTYTAVFNEQKISIKLNFSLNKTSFAPDEYEYLKLFFAELIKAQNENIILIKK